MRIVKFFAAALIASALLGTAIGCNAVEGVGKDIQGASRTVGDWMYGPID